MNTIRTVSPIQGLPIPDCIRRLLCVTAGAVLMAVNLNTFVHTGGMLPGGFTGLSLLIQNICRSFFGITVPFSVLNIFFNIGPAYISFRFIGKKFTLYSCLMIILSAVLKDSIPVFHVTDDILLCAIFGGLINGAAVCLCLFADATSGGTDFIAIFMAEKYGRDAWNCIFAGNCIILIAAGILFGWNKALYSILFQFTSTQILNYLFRRYQKATMLIITDKPEEIYAVIHRITNHDATVFRGTGCYRNKEHRMLYTVVSGEETAILAKEIRKADPAAFINVLQTKQILGKFYIRPTD